MIRRVLLINICLIALAVLQGCNKTDFLNVKPDRSMLIPSTLDDFQAILDKDNVMNGVDGQGLTPQLGESGTDNFYLHDSDFNTYLRPQMQNYYVWSEFPYAGVNVLDWEYPYRAILYANMALDGLNKIIRSEANGTQYDQVLGQALFHRAHIFYQLAQVFSPPFRKDATNEEPGIPLRFSSDINEKLKRATVKETYDQILDDLLKASDLLETEVVYNIRPSKQAAFGLLARVYQTMQDYNKALVYADRCLSIRGELLDFNLVDSLVRFPFGDQSNQIVTEIIFNSRMLSDLSQNYPTTFNFAVVELALYNSYEPDDLRKQIFFEKTSRGYRFRGNYTGSPQNFSGIATDEIYFIRAESYVRSGEIEKALNDVNTVLKSRWKKDTFIPFVSDNPEMVLQWILRERRKELLFRGLRWTDIRRLNIEGHNISLSREVNGQKYALPANDERWTWPFPDEVMF